MKRLLALLLSIASTCTFAGGNTAWAVPTRVDVVPGQGLMAYGAFGNPAGCTVSDMFWVPVSNPAYTQIYAALLTAIASGKEVSIYTSACTSVLWYAVESTTFNQPIGIQAFSVRN